MRSRTSDTQPFVVSWHVHADEEELVGGGVRRLGVMQPSCSYPRLLCAKRLVVCRKLVF